MFQRLTTPPKHDAAEQSDWEDTDAAQEIRKYLDLADIALGRKSRPILLKREDKISHPKRAA